MFEKQTFQYAGIYDKDMRKTEVNFKQFYSGSSPCGPDQFKTVGDGESPWKNLEFILRKVYP